jgi:hypothetical protein
MEHLRQKKLDSIKDDREEELRKRTSDDINVKVIPGEPLPPVLR